MEARQSQGGGDRGGLLTLFSIPPLGKCATSAPEYQCSVIFCTVARCRFYCSSLYIHHGIQWWAWLLLRCSRNMICSTSLLLLHWLHAIQMCEDTVTLWQRRRTLERHSWACTVMILPTVTGVSPHAAQVSKVAATSTAPHTVKDTQHTSQFAQSTMEWKHTAQCTTAVERWERVGGPWEGSKG